MNVGFLRKAKQVANYHSDEIDVVMAQDHGWRLTMVNRDHFYNLDGLLKEMSVRGKTSSPHPIVDSFMRHFGPLKDVDLELPFNGRQEARCIRNDLQDALDAYAAEMRSKAHIKRMHSLYDFYDRSKESLNEYIRDLFRTHKRLTVVNVNIFYAPKIAQEITIEELGADRTKYLNLLKKTYEEIVGLIWKLERSDERGLMLRLVIFTKSKQTDDTILSNVYGSLWLTMDGPEKRFENQSKLNAMKGLGAFSGTGVVDVNDTRKMFYLHNTVIEELIKFNDEIIAMMSKRVKCIGRMLNKAIPLPRVARR